MSGGESIAHRHVETELSRSCTGSEYARARHMADLVAAFPDACRAFFRRGRSARRMGTRAARAAMCRGRARPRLTPLPHAQVGIAVRGSPFATPGLIVHRTEARIEGEAARRDRECEETS